ncbi:DUF6414 family protein [Clostridium paraputrificum]|uniref:DUF6414 family protein n=1 Tax=Clostridium TaxID=1485 RepID=UPI003D350579
MDDYTLALLMYLDEGLVRNMSSFVLNGYIDIRTTRLTQDKTFIGSAGSDFREHISDDDRCTEDERDGYKGTNYTSGAHNENTNNNRAGVESRDFIRREEEIKKIYTTFTLHGQLITELTNKNSVKNFEDKTIKVGEVKEGDYVKIHGKLTSESVNSYLDSLLTVFDCFGCGTLDKMLPSNKENFYNFDNMNKMISHLNGILNKNSTQDMILMCGNTPVVLNVNSNFFMNNNAYIYDKVNCPCTVFGKVVSIATDGECISLLRKTAQHDYYEKIIKNCCTYCDILNSNGIFMPKAPRLKCEGVSLVVIPISICM